MRNITIVFWGSLAALSLLWLLQATDVFTASGLFQWRGYLIQYSGILSIGCMSLAMLLALRPRWPERWLNGLDKMYRLHKWLGISGLVLAVAHWLIAIGPKWAIQWQLIVRPQRGQRPLPENELQAFLAQFRGLSKEMGEWAFYACIVLISISLIKAIPYGFFRKSHELLPVAYLSLVFHSVVLTKLDYWISPLGAVMAIMLIGGTCAAIVSLLGLVGMRRRVNGRIVDLHGFPSVKSLQVEVEIEPDWPGHKPGQFAFAISDPKEGAHPYTIASSWDPKSARVTFITKALGDHTSTLEQKLEVGQIGTIEGPYGCFTFEDGQSVQIWIGGGIGITPFVAKMKELSQHDSIGTKVVHLYYSTAEIDDEALERLADLAKAAGVSLSVVIDSRDGRLTADRIRQDVPEWRDASFWFCGPPRFGQILRADFARHGVPVESRFHQELFEMR